MKSVSTKIALLLVCLPVLAQRINNPGGGGGPCTVTGSATSGFVLTSSGGTGCSWQSAGSASVDANSVKNAVFLTDGGTANAVTGTTATAFPGAYATGQAVMFKANATNTAATTININSLGNKNLTKQGATALAAGNKVSGTEYLAVYDGTQFQLIGFTAIAADIPTLNQNTTGNAATATALAADPADCSANQYAISINASGTLGCAQVAYAQVTGTPSNVASTANPLSQFAATTSAQLLGVLSDETGTGAAVFGTSPTLTTPALGTPSAVVLTNATGFPAAIMQTGQSNTVTTGTQDQSAATHTLPAATGTTAGKPATCKVGELYFANDATAGQNIFECAATNTWTQQLNSGGGGGGVSTVSVASANGFAGTVATATTTPAITISTSITGITKGNGTAISAATADTDYVKPAAPTPITFSATPTFDLSTCSRCEMAAMTANVTSVTITNPVAAKQFSLTFLQDATGARTVTGYTVAGGSVVNACVVNPAASSRSTCLYEVASDGVTIRGIGGTSDVSGVAYIPEVAAPATPATSNAVCWPDSTDHSGLECMANNSSNKFKLVKSGGDVTTTTGVVPSVNGTTVPTNATADQFLGTTASATAAWASVPNCGDSSHGLAYNTTTHAFSCQSITGAAGSPSFPINPQTATYQVLAADFTACKVISVASGTFTATLVASGTQPTNGQCIWIVNYGSGAVTVARSGQNINGGTASLTIPAGLATAPNAAFIVSDGTNYFGQLLEVPATTTCTNQAVTAVNGTAAATCTTLTSAYMDTSIAKTGTDVNTSNQVTVTHLASALPVNQGGTGTVSTLTGLVRGSAGAMTAAEISADCTTSGSNAITCTKTNGSAFVASATTDTTNATNIGSGTLGAARLPAVAMQTGQSNTVTTGTQDQSAATHTLPAVTGTTAAKPATCKVGELYFANDATPGQNVYECAATNTWTQEVNSGNSGGVVAYSAPSITLTSTVYAPFGGGGTPSTTESQSQVPAATSATLANLSVASSVVPGAGNTLVFTVRKGSAPTAITCTITAAATSCSDLTHSISVSQGDLLDVQFAPTGTVVATPMIMFNIQVGTTNSNGVVNSGTSGNFGYYAGTGTSISDSAKAIPTGTVVGTTDTQNLTNKTVNKVTITAPTTGSTLTIADGKTLTTNNTLTLAGTDSTTMTFPTTSATVARTDAANTFTGHQTVEGVTSTGATGTGAFVFGTSPSLTTPSIGAATGTSLLATGNIDGTAPMTVTTGSSATLGGTFKSGYTLNENATAATAITYTLPTAAAGLQYCVANAYNGSAANTGVITLATSASGQFLIWTDGTLSATGGNTTSGGAGGDFACVVGVDSTHWMFRPSNGTWTKH